MDELLNAILDGEASEQDVVELESLAGDDSALVSQLADRIAEHRLLGLLHQPFDPAMCVDATNRADLAFSCPDAGKVSGGHIGRFSIQPHGLFFQTNKNWPLARLTITGLR